MSVIWYEDITCKTEQVHKMQCSKLLCEKFASHIIWNMMWSCEKYFDLIQWFCIQEIKDKREYWAHIPNTDIWIVEWEQYSTFQNNFWKWLLFEFKQNIGNRKFRYFFFLGKSCLCIFSWTNHQRKTTRKQFISQIPYFSDKKIIISTKNAFWKWLSIKKVKFQVALPSDIISLWYIVFLK